MSFQHLVRVGTIGHVGRFTASDATRYVRGSRVICETVRGLEVGEVLADADDYGAADGTISRGVTTQDDLLLARLQRNRDDAVAACERMIADRGLPAVLIDVEHLFDGKSLYFYFLGEVTAELSQLTSELAETYEAQVQFRKFTDTLLEGCGPDCGTEAAAGGCGEGGCGSCAIAEACHTSEPGTNGLES